MDYITDIQLHKVKDYMKKKKKNTCIMYNKTRRITIMMYNKV